MQMINKIKWSHLFLQFLRFFLWNKFSSVNSKNLSFANLFSNKKPKSSLRNSGLADSHLWQSNDSRIFCWLTLRRVHTQLSFLGFSHKSSWENRTGGRLWRMVGSKLGLGNISLGIGRNSTFQNKPKTNKLKKRVSSNHR